MEELFQLLFLLGEAALGLLGEVSLGLLGEMVLGDSKFNLEVARRSESNSPVNSSPAAKE